MLVSEVARIYGIKREGNDARDDSKKKQKKQNQGQNQKEQAKDMYEEQLGAMSLTFGGNGDSVDIRQKYMEDVANTKAFKDLCYSIENSKIVVTSYEE